MISIYLRISLLIVSVGTCWYMMNKIRKSQIKIEDTIFWICLSFALVIISLFPNLLLSVALCLEVDSPVNFVFLSIIFLLLIKLFSVSAKLSKVEHKLDELIEEYAISKYENKI